VILLWLCGSSVVIVVLLWCHFGATVVPLRCHCESTLVIVAVVWKYCGGAVMIVWSSCGRCGHCGRPVVTCGHLWSLVVALWWRCGDTVTLVALYFGHTVAIVVVLWSSYGYCGHCGATKFIVVPLMSL